MMQVKSLYPRLYVKAPAGATLALTPRTRHQWRRWQGLCRSQVPPDVEGLQAQKARPP